MHTLRGLAQWADLTSTLNIDCHTTLLHGFYLAATQILEYTPTQRLPTRLQHNLYANNGARIY